MRCDAFGHDQLVAALGAVVVDRIHALADQVNAQPAGFAVVEGQVEVGRRHLERVEA